MTDTRSDSSLVSVPDPDSRSRSAYMGPEELAEISQTSVFRELASARMPEAVRVFIDCDGGDQGLRANEQAWEQWALRPRVLVDVGECDTTTTALGRALDTPIMVSPFTCSNFCHPDAEVAIAQGTLEAGTLMVLSARALKSPEDIQATGAPFWYHMDYKVTKRPDVAKTVVQRAEATGADALCLTVDLPLFPPLWPPEMMAAHLDALDYVPYSADITGWMHQGVKRDYSKMRTFSRSHVTWSDIEWLQGETKLPIVLKGIQTAEDANLACESGVAGIIVSNHGGHASADTLGTAEILPEVVDAAAGRAQVFVDGGIRTGADVLRALALGASAAMVGRSALWGVTVGGAPGVARAIEILHEQLKVNMAVTGARSIAEINRSMIAERRQVPRR